jgi:IstB-like ATP binding protein
VDGRGQHRPHRSTQEPPLFRLAQEQARLHRLPRVAHTVCFGETRKVSWQSTISVGGARYSVPHPLIDERVWARVHGVGRVRAMTVRTPPPRPLPDEVDRLLRRLRLPYVRRAAPEVIATAASQRWEPAEVLRVLLAEEAAGRDHATITMRRKASGLPAGKTFDAWDAQAAAIPASTQNALRTLEWIDRGEVLAVCGPSEWASNYSCCGCSAGAGASGGRAWRAARCRA